MKLTAVVGIAVTQLRRDRTRTALVAVGIALAVLASTTLAAVGIGVLQTGEQKFDQSGRDLWITGGPVKFAPGSVGGFENTLFDAHRVSAEIRSREDVRTAVPLSFQTVYVSTDGDEFETLVGAGTTSAGSGISVTEGKTLDKQDPHYADGSYDGPWTREVVISPRTANLLGVGVNDTVYIGGTLASARENQFRIVGISPTFSSFLGAPTVVLYLSELQEVTGATGTDSATLITIDLKSGTDTQAVGDELQATYPDYDVRTNREQLEATLQEQVVILASGLVLVVFAAIIGIALTANLLLSYVFQRRRELAALKAIGMTSRTLVEITVVQSLLLGVLGGGVGIGLSVAAVPVLNAVASLVVGFGDVVSVDAQVLAAGFVLALVMSVVAGAAASVRVSGLDPLEQLA